MRKRRDESGIIVRTKPTVKIDLYRNCKVIGNELDCWGKRR